KGCGGLSDFVLGGQFGLALYLTPNCISVSGFFESPDAQFAPLAGGLFFDEAEFEVGFRLKFAAENHEDAVELIRGFGAENESAGENRVPEVGALGIEFAANRDRSARFRPVSTAGEQSFVGNRHSRGII